MISFDELIEATLTGVEFNDGGSSIKLCFVTANKSLTENTSARLDLSFKGVDSLIGDGLRHINIVDSVEVHSGSDIDVIVVQAELTYLFQGGDIDVVPPRLAQHTDAIREGNLTLLKLVPVCGATLTVLAQQVLLEWRL